MVALTHPARLLSAWEAAAAVPYSARGAVLVWHAGLIGELDAALDQPVGRLAALAASAHVALFGDEVESRLTCPSCGQTLDVTIPVGRLAAVDAGASTAVVGSLVVRAPTTRDLLAVAPTPSISDRVAALLSRCVREADGRPVDPSLVDGDTMDRVDAAAEDLAGAAGLVVGAACPDCAASVEAPLDLAGLLWERVATAAPAVLSTVAELAAAYGWSEAEVLALSPARQRAYLALIRQAQS